MVCAFVDELFLEPAVTKVQADPSPENERAIRSYLRAGFQPRGAVPRPMAQPYSWSDTARAKGRMRRGHRRGAEAGTRRGVARQPSDLPSSRTALLKRHEDARGPRPRHAGAPSCTSTCPTRTSAASSCGQAARARSLPADGTLGAVESSPGTEAPPARREPLGRRGFGRPAAPADPRHWIRESGNGF
jgi:hypothetical protein